MSAPSRGSRDRIFEIVDNGLDRSSIAAQNVEGRVSFPPFNFAKAYLKGDLDIHIQLGSSFDQPEGELVFRAIPVIHEELDYPACPEGTGEVSLGGGFQRNGMLRAIGEFTEDDKIVSASGIFVASRVWLKPPEKIVQRDGKTWVSFSLRGVPELEIQIIRMRSDREMDVSDIRAVNGHDGSESRMIEGVFNVPEGVTGKLAEFVGNVGYAGLYKQVACLRVGIEEDRISAIVEKPFRQGIKLLKIFFRPAKQLPRA